MRRKVHYLIFCLLIFLIMSFVSACSNTSQSNSSTSSQSNSGSSSQSDSSSSNQPSNQTDSEKKLSLQIGDMTFEGNMILKDNAQEITSGDRRSIEFDQVSSQSLPVAFYGAACSEVWVLDLTLDLAESYGEGFYGRYEGDYTIAIHYDMSDFQVNAPALFYDNGWITEASFPEWFETWTAQPPTLVNEGIFVAGRVLTGSVTISFESDEVIKVEASNEGDVADIMAKDITVNVFLQASYGDNSAYADYTFSADAAGASFDVTDWGTGVTGSIGAGGGRPFKLALDPALFLRGNAIVLGEWVISIS